MGDDPESPKIDLDGFVRERLRQIAEAVRLAGRKSYRTSYECQADGMRYTLGGKKGRPKKPKAGEKCDDLPDLIAKQSTKVRRVYRSLRECRRLKGDDVSIWQQDIFEALGGDTSPDPISLRHVHRVIKILCKLDVIRRHEEFGYLIGGRQPTLTF